MLSPAQPLPTQPSQNSTNNINLINYNNRLNNHYGSNVNRLKSVFYSTSSNQPSLLNNQTISTSMLSQLVTTSMLQPDKAMQPQQPENNEHENGFNTDNHTKTVNFSKNIKEKLKNQNNNNNGSRSRSLSTPRSKNENGSKINGVLLDQFADTSDKPIQTKSSDNSKNSKLNSFSNSTNNLRGIGEFFFLFFFEFFLNKKSLK